MREEVYSGALKLYGNEHPETIREVNNYTSSLINLERFEESKSLLCTTIPVARRILGESHETTIRLRWNYAESLANADSATLGDLREAVTTLAEIERTARRVFGGAHPRTVELERDLQGTRAVLRENEKLLLG